MGKSSEYRQITVKLPPLIFQILEEYARKRSLTLQDALVVILLDYFGLIGGEEE